MMKSKASPALSHKSSVASLKHKASAASVKSPLERCRVDDAQKDERECTLDDVG